MNDLQEVNPYPQFDEQQESNHQIEEPTASQAIPVIQQNIVIDNNTQARTIGEASSEERKQFLTQSLRALLVQQMFQLSLAMSFAFVEEWGFCSNFFLFLFFTLSLHLFIATYKARGLKKEEGVMKLQWLGWMVCYSFATTLFSTLLNVLYLGWFFYLPFLTMAFLFPMITLGMIIHLSSGSACISVKQYSIIFFVAIFFIDLSISVFDDGFIHFGYLLGEVVAYLYGLYLAFINVQIQYPVNDLSLNIQQEETKLDQMINFLDRGTQKFELGAIPAEAQEITMEEIKKQSNAERLLKLAILQSFCIVFYLFPWLYFTLVIWVMMVAHKADTKFVQIGKKQEVKLNEQFVAPILINLDILGGLKHAIE
ncbi:unnamed protein product (macronuclear) [Paramecium tetraurelia]|uniref:Transmembrane protein n=1 Tax=Paramecium tetraurelia TaxID=5888 RepID=A0CCI4_PARTE|nr:uncharacterized protein GSPATT00037286001 [Paramecium tetraurelia]CAK68501.1 unnamed protein product [Paramecium tetraurelia]|eukprot:XP_001435898.1 hypothetical protein (macronuclear) [Paramecium tetraurelia strain d4-2]